MFSIVFKRGFSGIGSLPETGTKFAPDAVAKLSLGEKGAK
jgi:hypothetical protein